MEHRKLFEDVPDDIDENWTWGALIGGMATMQTTFELAQSYKRAGDILSDQIPKKAEAYEIIYPIIFIYRHSIELFLKIILKWEKRKHSLDVLIDNFKKLVEEKGYELPENIENNLREFHLFDSKSTQFRYIDKENNEFIPGEYWLDINNLKKFMDKIESGFKKIYFNN